MKQETTSVPLRVLRAEEGRWITPAKQATDLAPYFTKIVYLGTGDAPESWCEVTDEERATREKQWLSEQESDRAKKI